MLCLLKALGSCTCGRLLSKQRYVCICQRLTYYCAINQTCCHDKERYCPIHISRGMPNKDPALRQANVFILGLLGK